MFTIRDGKWACERIEDACDFQRKIIDGNEEDVQSDELEEESPQKNYGIGELFRARITLRNKLESYYLNNESALPRLATFLYWMDTHIAYKRRSFEEILTVLDRKTTLKSIRENSVLLTSE